MFCRCLNQGYEALLVKTADILDNSDYIELVTDYDTKCYLIDKIYKFLTISEDIIASHYIWNELNNVYSRLKITCSTQ